VPESDAAQISSTSWRSRQTASSVRRSTPSRLSCYGYTWSLPHPGIFNFYQFPEWSTMSESTPGSTPVSIAVIAATSSPVRAKSKRSMFWAIRSRFADFGIATDPSSTCQRSTICARVLPYFPARAASVGCSSRSVRGARGPQETVTMP